MFLQTISGSGFKIDGGVRFVPLPPVTTLTVNYLIVGGGGSGGFNGNDSGGGGAGGYRSSVAGELSGQNSSPESPLTLDLNTPYSVSVGNGGIATGSGNGQSSTFGSITALGGGRGAAGSSTIPAGSGGSGGGGSDVSGLAPGGSGTTNQGFPGGNFATDGGGGGGASEPGYPGNHTGPPAKPSQGGNGLQSNISGTLTYYAGGGGGGIDTTSPTDRGKGGLGGGGNGKQGNGSGGNGEEGRGGGGGGVGGTGTGGNGGSGVVIVRYSATFTGTLTDATGVTYTVGSDRVTLVNGTSGAEPSITFTLT